MSIFLPTLFLFSTPQVRAYSLTQAIQPIATPAPSSPSPDSYLQFYGVLLSSIAVIIAAVIAGAFVIYQVRKNSQLEREKQQIQFKLDSALQERQHQAERETRYDEKLSTQREEKKRERQQILAAAAAAKAVMTSARTPAEYEQAYRDAICNDPNITHLQILDMSQPLEVTKIYVRLRLHAQPQLRYEVEPALRLAEQRQDPNALLKAGWAFLETKSHEAMTPEDALQKYPRCVILGDPGAGKSTLLKYLTLRSVKKQLPNLPDLPIHIELAEFAYSDSQDLIEFAATRWDERYGFRKDEARAFIEQHLENGTAILLLDALDETVIGESEEIAAESYRQVLAAIGRITTRYPKAPIVVTARKAGYYRRPRLNGFTELEVLDFRFEEMQQFIVNWFANHTVPRRHATADDLNKQLEQAPRMQALAANPLLLCLIVMVYEVQQDLPEKRAELYKQCIDTLLFKWDTSRDIRRLREFKPEHKRQLLMEIAWHFHQQGRRYFPEDELFTVIANFLPTIKYSSQQCRLILSEIEEENALLKEQAHGWHGFLHLTLQEYFVALYLSENNKLDELLKYCGDPWWEEVFSLYAGSVFDASPLLQKLLKQEKGQLLWKDVFHTSLLWAGRCLAAQPRVKQTSLREKVIDRLFELYKKTSYSLTKMQTMSILIDIGGDEVKARLLAIAKNKQNGIDVRRSSVAVVGELGDRTVILDLLAIVKDKQNDKYIRWEAVFALGKLGERVIVPELLAIVKDKQNNSLVRREAVFVLGKLGERVIVPELLAILKDKQSDYFVRRNVIDALKGLGERAVIPELLAIVKDKQGNEYIRRNVIDALGKLGEQAVIPELLAIVKDKQSDKHIRRNAVYALEELGEQAVIPELLAVVKDKQDDEYVRWNVINVLGKLGERAVIPELLAIVKDKQSDKHIRRNAVYALGKLGERVIILELLAIVKDKRDDSGVRRDAIDALGKLEDRVVVPDLLAIVKDKQDDSSVRRGAVDALGELGDRVMVPDLLVIVKDKQNDSEARWDALVALGKLGVHEGVTRHLIHLIPKVALRRFNYYVEDIINEFVQDLPAIHATAKLLRSRKKILVNVIHESLWTISQSEKVRILMIDWKFIKLVKVRKR